MGILNHVRSSEAIRIIRQCIAAERYDVTMHFADRMHERHLFWGDILAVIDSPRHVNPDGRDELDRPRWLVAGNATDGTPLELVCVFDFDELGERVVLITIYRENSR